MKTTIRPIVSNIEGITAVGTTDRHYLHAGDGRVAVFTGADGRTASGLELYASTDEIARFATLFAGETARVDFDRPRGVPSEADGVDLNASLADIAPHLAVRPQAWPAARRLLAAAWGIDIANHPVALHTESKYTVDVNSASAALLTVVRAALLTQDILAARIGKIRKPSKHWDGHVAVDYRNWPEGVAEATDAVLLTQGDAVAAEVEAHPRRWVKAERRSGWLYRQYENDWAQPQPDDDDLRAWRPAPDGPEDIRPQSSYIHGSDVLYPADDRGLAAFADRELTLTFGAWPITLTGPLATHLAIARQRVARSPTPRTEWSKPVIATATIAEEDELAAVATKLPFSLTGGLIARAYLLDRDHDLAMLVGFGYARETVARAPLAGESLGFAFAVSPAQTLPTGALALDDAGLIATLDALPWTLARAAGGSDLETRTLASLLVDPVVFAKRGVVRFAVKLEVGDPGVPMPRATVSRYDTEAPVATPALVELAEFEAEPHVFKFDPETGTQALQLALTNVACGLRFYADNLTSEDAIGVDALPTAYREELVARLQAQAAIVSSLGATKPTATWTQTEAGFAFDAQLTLPDGRELSLAREVAVSVGPERSPVKAREHAQRSFVNDGLKTELEAVLSPDRREAETAWHAVVMAMIERRNREQDLDTAPELETVAAS